MGVGKGMSNYIKLMTHKKRDRRCDRTARIVLAARPQLCLSVCRALIEEGGNGERASPATPGQLRGHGAPAARPESGDAARDPVFRGPVGGVAQARYEAQQSGTG